MRSYAIRAFACICVLCAVGCDVARDPTTTSASTEASSSTSVALLPSQFPHRRNRGNDGTQYEPCTSLTVQAASALAIDPNSIRDAALVDGQTARGCDWSYRNSRWWVISQIVGNSPSLRAYKASQRNYRWRDDVSVAGRIVAISEIDETTCATHVQSGSAGVTTMVQFAFTNGPTIDEICNRAIEFTKATIDKMPP